MTESKSNTVPEWNDDDIPEWTDDIFDRAQLSIGGKVIHEATGTLTKRGRPKSADPKRQVTLRLDSVVIDGFRAQGRGWQSKINGELRKALGL
jgi:uncharacterized protein (DUF4415 family)